MLVLGSDNETSNLNSSRILRGGILQASYSRRRAVSNAMGISVVLKGKENVGSLQDGGRRIQEIDRSQHPVSLCVGCGTPIYDQYILRVAPDLEWHAACLKCVDCQQFLDETCTCFVREGKTYCKSDYVRIFGTKCSKCRQVFSRQDLVMRARNKIFHIDCFRCVACDRQLIPGDEFALKGEELLCRDDHIIDDIKTESNNNSEKVTDHNRANKRVRLNSENADPYSDEGSPVSSIANSPGFQNKNDLGGRTSKSEGKTTRVRTVLTEKQLHTLRTCYSANPRPDALMKEQLVEMTGLSPRVIRVWFQNKRCKDKKRSILMKQMHNQDKDGIRRSQGVGPTLHGIPLIASSPVRHDSPMGNMQPVEIQTYHPPWKMLSDFAMQNDLDRVDPNTPSFQHLVSQMQGYTRGDPRHPITLSELGSCYDPLQHNSQQSDLGPFPGTPSELSSPCISE